MRELYVNRNPAKCIKTMQSRKPYLNFLVVLGAVLIIQALTVTGTSYTDRTFQKLTGLFGTGCLVVAMIQEDSSPRKLRDQHNSLRSKK
jgi:hypothetical protein